MTAYNVILSDGLKNILIPPRQVSENLASIPLLGRDVAGYGDVIATAQLRMLENFASPTAPTLPLDGQLWFDKNVNQVKVYTTTDGWQTVAEPAPETLDDLTDVTITAPSSGEFLRYDSGVWKNLAYEPSFLDLTDTPNQHLSRAFLRVNQAGTELVYISKIPAADITGVFDISQMPLDELCQWLRDVCLPTVDPPDPIHTLSLSCSSVSNVAGGCSGTFEVPEPVVTVQGGIGPFVTTIVLDSITRSGSTLSISNPDYTQGSNATIDWSVSNGSSGNAVLTGTYTITVLDQATNKTVTQTHSCQTGVVWGCNISPPDPDEYDYTVTINGASTLNDDGFTVSTLGATVAEGTSVSITITRSDSDWGLVGVTGCGGTLSGSAPNYTYAFTMPSNNCSVNVVTIGAQQNGCTPRTNPAESCEGTAQIGGPVVEVLGGATGPFDITITEQTVTETSPAGFNLNAGSLSYDSVNNFSTVEWDADDDTDGTATIEVEYDAVITHVASGAQATISGMTCSSDQAWDCPAVPPDPTGNVNSTIANNFTVLGTNQGYAENLVQLRSDGGIYITGCTSITSPCGLPLFQKVGDWIVNGFAGGDTAADYSFTVTDVPQSIPFVDVVLAGSIGPTSGNMGTSPTWTMVRSGTGTGIQEAVFDVAITAPGALTSGTVRVTMMIEKS